MTSNAPPTCSRAEDGPAQPVCALFTSCQEGHDLEEAVNRSPYSQNCREAAFFETRLQDWGRTKRPVANPDREMIKVIRTTGR